MPLVLADRVRETTTTTGTGTISLAGPVSGFQGFSTAIGNANTTYYTIVDAATGAWEVGLGTYTSSGSTLARTTVLSSSNSDALVPFASGTKDVFVTQPAERAVYILGAGTGLAAGAAAFTANGVPYADSTSTLATSSNLTFNGTTLTANALTTTSTVTLSGGTANGVAYLNGSKVLTTGSALVFDGTSLGVGAATPIAVSGYSVIRINGSTGGLLELTSGNTRVLQIQADGASAGAQITTVNNGSNPPLIFGVNSSEQMRLTSTGLGIGTSSPSSFSGYTTVSVNNATNGGIYNILVNGTETARLQAFSGIFNVAAKGAATNLTFETNGAERIRLDTSGNLGIGTTNPAQKLVVSLAGAQGLEISPDAVASAPALVAYNRSGGAYVQLSALALQHVWQAGASPTEAMRLTSTGLGIGTSSPSQKLTVNGSANLAGRGSSFAFMTPDWRMYNTSSGNAFVWDDYTTERMRLDSSGNLGIGTSSPSQKLTVLVADAAQSTSFQAATGRVRFRPYADATSGAVIDSTNTAEGAYLPLTLTASTLRLFGGGGTGAVVDSSGNLGLGVTPSAWHPNTKAIDVSAGAAFWGSSVAFGVASAQYGNAVYDATGPKYKNTASASGYEQGFGGGHRWLNAPSGTAGDAISFTQAMTLDASGNLGVGTTSPFADTGYRSIDIRGSSTGAQINLGTTATRVGQITCDTTNGLTFNTTTATPLRFFTEGNERARIDSSGNLLVQSTSSSVTSGVGHKIRPDAAAPFMGTVGSSTSGADVTYSLYSTGAAAYRFYVGYNGTISATTTTISAISDIRFKENVRDLDVGLEKIMALKPRLYDWKKGKGADIKNARGFIAQEFEQVFPDLIDEWKDPAPEGEEPYKAVRADLIPVLVKAIQELKAEFDAYKATHP
jgi:hypothetical protein